LKIRIRCFVMILDNSKKIQLRFSVGLLTGGDVYVAELDQNFDLESGISLFAFYDFFITDKFAIGPNISISFPTLALLDDGVNFYELAFAIKPKFGLSDTVSYKPGFNLGYRIITASDIDDVGGTIQGLGLNITNELQFKVNDNLTPFIDIGFISQAAGGNEDFNVTFAPLIVLRAGLVFN
ncbi:MAG: hypothetical protein AAFQ20_12585, partial [Bacteroidota bacterium]